MNTKVKDFRAAIVQLRSDVDFPQEWLKPFEEGTFDEIVNTRVRADIDAQRDGAFPHEPLHVEALLGDISVLLDRCHSYRREAADLELSAYKAASEYLQSRRTLHLERLVLASSSAEKALLSKAAALRTSETEFLATAAGDKSLTKGCAAFCHAESEHVAALAAIDGERRTIAGRKLDVIADLASAAQTRYSAPGNAHNFSQRRDRILVLALEDISEAFEKARSAFAGLKLVYGYTAAPEVKVSALDELTLWTRAAMREVERQNEATFYTQFLFPLQSAIPGAAADAKPMVSGADWGASMGDKGNGVVRFEMGAAFRNMKTIRVRGIGLSFVPKEDKSRSSRLSAVIFPPEQPFGIGGAKYRRPPVVIGGVKPLSPDAVPEVVRDESVHNIDPRTGFWEIRVTPEVVSGVVEARKRWTELADLVLHLEVLCTASSEPADWK